jgi:hypothetical protein
MTYIVIVTAPDHDTSEAIGPVSAETASRVWDDALAAGWNPETVQLTPYRERASVLTIRDWSEGEE